MTEEVSTRRIDTVCTASEVDLVEIELEDLFLGEFPFHRHGQNGFAQFAIKRAIAVQKHVTGELLSNGRGRPQPILARGPDINGSGEAVRIHTRMRVEAPVFHRNHGIFHDLRNLVGRNPLPIARAKLDEFRAVSRPDDNRLRVLCRLELVIARQGPRGECHSDCQKNEPENGYSRSPQEQPAQPDFQTAGVALAFRCRSPSAFGTLAAFAAAASLIHSSRLSSCSRRAALYLPQCPMARRNLGLTDHTMAARYAATSLVQTRVPPN